MTAWLERQRHFIDYTLSALMRQKGKNLALILVYTLVIFLIASVLLLTHAIRQEAKAVLAESPALLVQRLKAGRHDVITAEYAEAIAAIRGVASVNRRLWGYYYDPLTGANYTLMASDAHDVGPDQVSVGEGVARVLGNGVGGAVSLTAYDGETIILEIARVFSADSALVSADLLVVAEATLRRLFGMPPGEYTDLAVVVKNVNEVLTVARKIVKQFPDARPILKREILQTYDSLFNWRSGMLVVLLAGTILAFFIFAWDKATGLSVAEKAEIGILKALGWETADVLAMKFWEGLMLSLTSFLIGFGLAYIHVFWGKVMFIEPAIKGWSVLYPQFRLLVTISFYQVAQLFILTILPYTFLTIVPAWKAAIADPDVMMRSI